MLPNSFNRIEQGGIWFHAVSVGEIASCAPLIKEMHAADNRVPIYVSTGTAAGRKAAEERLGSFASGIFYFPIDYVPCIAHVLKKLKPALVVILETEIWPNFFWEVRRTGARLALVNARISSNTWPQYRRMKWLFAPVLQLADEVFPQSGTDKKRYVDLGVPERRVHMEGNLKYDAPSSVVPLTLPTFGAKHIWIAASTVGPGESGRKRKAFDLDEDDAVIAAFVAVAKQMPELLLVLAPRQPARFDVVANKLRSRGISYVRRTAFSNGIEPALALPGVLLLDTIGELSRIFAMADVVFVGGSLAPRGGHNILEPAAAGVPVVIGPHMYNFENMTRDLHTSGALEQIRQVSELAPAIVALLNDPDRRAAMGEKGRALVCRHKGISTRIANRLWPLYYAKWYSLDRSLFARMILGSLAKLWEWGGDRKRDRGERLSRCLPTPVISVGGVTIGGSGKTPFVSYLCDRLKRQGFEPVILTRGYRRRSPANNLLFEPGQDVSSALTGDEAQIFLQTAVAPVGIGADRYNSGELALEHLPQTDIFVLDDGFQHARLRRNLDIVMIDGLDPFGHGAVVPLGRLREPLTSFARAHAFVVSRADHDYRFEAIRQQLQALNVSAPVFRGRTKVSGWRSFKSRERKIAPPSRKVGAFCGLGNPKSFWSTLEEQGFEVVYHWHFGDHHLYSPLELQRFAYQARANGAELLVTTQKDRMNLPGEVVAAVKPLDLWWVEIEMHVEHEEQLFEFIGKRIQSHALSSVCKIRP